MKGQDIQKKLDFFGNKRLHISCNNKRFYNGFILDISYEKNVLVFIDNKSGEVPILFEEINFIELFRENKNDR